MRCLCAGREARKDVGRFDGLGQLRRRSWSRPGCRAAIFSALMPTSVQTLRVTRSLSPVSTLTVTPCWRSAVMALVAVSLGGSRKAR